MGRRGRRSCTQRCGASGTRCRGAQCVPTACLNSVVPQDQKHYNIMAQLEEAEEIAVSAVAPWLPFQSDGGPAVSEQWGSHLAACSQWRAARQPHHTAFPCTAGWQRGDWGCIGQDVRGRGLHGCLDDLGRSRVSRHHVFAVKFRACVAAGTLYPDASKVSIERISFTNCRFFMTATHAMHHPSCGRRECRRKSASAELVKDSHIPPARTKSTMLP